MLLLKTAPGDQVVVIPDWVYKTLAAKGKIEDLMNFAKMRQWFSQDQLIAIDVFSHNALSTLWYNGAYDIDMNNPWDHATRSLGYCWFFPEDHGQSVNGNQSDDYAKNKISSLGDLSQNKPYSLKLVEEYIFDELRAPNKNNIDINQSYSVYSGSDKLIVVVLNQGCLAPLVLERRNELRLSILREVLKKLQAYHALNVVAKTKWFEWYLTELNGLK